MQVSFAQTHRRTRCE